MSRNPIARFRRWVDGNGWWNDKDESELRGNVRKQVSRRHVHIASEQIFAQNLLLRNHMFFLQLLHAIQAAEKVEKPPLSDLFTDVYENTPSNLIQQEELLRQTIERHPQDYPSDVPL